MNLNEYAEKALKTMKRYPTAREQETDALLGLAGETGEVCDLLKKHYAGVKELDRDHLKKELGDVMWYLAELCHVFGFTMNEVAEANIAKLAARHGASYSGYGDRSGAGH